MQLSNKGAGSIKQTAFSTFPASLAGEVFSGGIFSGCHGKKKEKNGSADLCDDIDKFEEFETR